VIGLGFNIEDANIDMVYDLNQPLNLTAWRVNPEVQRGEFE